MPDCAGCLQPVDDDGVTTSNCPVNRAANSQCEDCGFCYCDGSC